MFIKTHQTLYGIEDDLYVCGAIRRGCSDGQGELGNIFLQKVGQRQPVFAREPVKFLVELSPKLDKIPGGVLSGVYRKKWSTQTTSRELPDLLLGDSDAADIECFDIG